MPFYVLWVFSLFQDKYPEDPEKCRWGKLYCLLWCLDVIVVVSKGMQAVGLCFNKIFEILPEVNLYKGCKMVAYVCYLHVTMLVAAARVWMAERVSMGSTDTLVCAQRSSLVLTARLPCGRVITGPAAMAELAQTMPPIHRYTRWDQRWTCPALASVATVQLVSPEIAVSSGLTGVTARMFHARMGPRVVRWNICLNVSVLPAGSAPSVMWWTFHVQQRQQFAVSCILFFFCINLLPAFVQQCVDFSLGLLLNASVKLNTECLDKLLQPA